MYSCTLFPILTYRVTIGGGYTNEFKYTVFGCVGMCVCVQCVCARVHVEYLYFNPTSPSLAIVQCVQTLNSSTETPSKFSASLQRSVPELFRVQ